MFAILPEPAKLIDIESTAAVLVPKCRVSVLAMVNTGTLTPVLLMVSLAATLPAFKYTAVLVPDKVNLAMVCVVTPVTVALEVKNKLSVFAMEIRCGLQFAAVPNTPEEPPIQVYFCALTEKAHIVQNKNRINF